MNGTVYFLNDSGEVVGSVPRDNSHPQVVFKRQEAQKAGFREYHVMPGMKISPEVAEAIQRYKDGPKETTHNTHVDWVG